MTDWNRVNLPNMLPGFGNQRSRRCISNEKKYEETPTIDDILLQEIYSLKEKLKIATYHLYNLDPNFDIDEYVHSLNSVDFDTWIEEFEIENKN